VRREWLFSLNHVLQVFWLVGSHWTEIASKSREKSQFEVPDILPSYEQMRKEFLTERVCGEIRVVSEGTCNINQAMNQRAVPLLSRSRERRARQLLDAPWGFNSLVHLTAKSWHSALQITAERTIGILQRVVRVEQGEVASQPGFRFRL
jgi:hypothetical protein